MAMEPVDVGDGSYRKRLHIDISNQDLEGVSIGSKVRLVVTGTVVSLRAPEKYTMETPDGKEKERVNPPEMCVMVESEKVTKTGDGQIEALVESDAEEDY